MEILKIFRFSQNFPILPKYFSAHLPLTPISSPDAIDFVSRHLRISFFIYFPFEFKFKIFVFLVAWLPCRPPEAPEKNLRRLRFSDRKIFPEQFPSLHEISSGSRVYYSIESNNNTKKTTFLVILFQYSTLPEGFPSNRSLYSVPHTFAYPPVGGGIQNNDVHVKSKTSKQIRRPFFNQLICFFFFVFVESRRVFVVCVSFLGKQPF